MDETSRFLALIRNKTELNKKELMKLSQLEKRAKKLINNQELKKDADDLEIIEFVKSQEYDSLES